MMAQPRANYQFIIKDNGMVNKHLLQPMLVLILVIIQLPNLYLSIT